MELSLWDDLRVLLAVSELSTFKGAGEALALSTSTVGRRIDALETAVQRSLVRRTSEGAVMLPAAAKLLRVASHMREELALALRDEASEGSSLSGAIRMSLGPGFVPLVMPVVASFREAHPRVSFEFIVEARASDLTRREADIGLRTFRRAGDGLVYRAVGPLTYALYASPSYLEGKPALDLAHYSEHDFVGFEAPLAQDPALLWLVAHGARRFPCRASTLEAALACAVSAQGIAVLPCLMADGAPGLVQVDDEGEGPPSKAIFLALHADLRRVTRMRAFSDHLTFALKSEVR